MPLSFLCGYLGCSTSIAWSSMSVMASSRLLLVRFDTRCMCKLSGVIGVFESQVGTVLRIDL